MKLEDMLRQVRQRTGVRGKDAWLIDELTASLDRLWKRIYTVFPKLQITFNTTGTFSVNTQEWALATDVNANIYGVVAIWIKDVTESSYQQVVFMDSNRGEFVARDQTTAQVQRPVYADIENFNQVRFAPAMPSGAAWRVDWIGKPTCFSLTTNCVTTIPNPLAQPIVDHTTQVIFALNSDERASFWPNDVQAGRQAVYALKARQSQNLRTVDSWPKRWS